MYYVPQHHVPAAQFAPQGWFGDQVSHYAPVIGSTLGGLTTQLTESPALGGLAGGIATTVARDYGGLIPFQAGPGGMPQPVAYAPQGFWGNMISGVGGAVGQVVGGNTGNIIRDASALGRYLPFEAGPMQAAQPVAYAPQGFWGNMISGVGGAVGQVVGGNTGNIIRDASALGRYLPFEAGPMAVAQPAAYDPQGIFGNIGGRLLGGAIGGAFGNRQLGSTLGGAVGNLLPFEAGPGGGVMHPAYAPQGFWGNMIKGVGGAVGDVVGGNTGNIIRDASALGQYLPFDAGPSTVPQVSYAPQGIFGSIGGKLLGGAIGGALGNRNLGSTLGGLAGSFLPFEAGPGGGVQHPVAYAPQGFWGNVVSGVGNAVGGIVGGKTGNIIRDASGLARYLPFEAGPMSAAQPVAYAPQGILGSVGGGLLGGVIGGAFGNRNLGSAIGGAVGAFLPFQAGPGQPIQYIPVADVQAAAAAQAAAVQPQTAQVVYL